MEIDWITVGAQAVNFVVLVLLLRHVLYRRIVRAVERRQAGIQAHLDEARDKEAEAAALAEAHERELEEVRERREQLLRDAREDAEKERERRLEEVREEVRGVRERWRVQLAREREDVLGELEERAARATWSVVERTLADLADEELQHRVVGTFLTRLEAAGLAGALATSGTVVVRSAFELSEEERERIDGRLRDTLGVRGEVDVQVDPELVLGLRLEAGDREVQWSVRDHLKLLEERVGELLEESDGEGA